MWEPGRALLPCTTSAPAGRYGGPGIREYPQGIYRSSARLRPYRGYAEALAMTNPRRQECCDALPRTTNATRNARTSARNMSVAAKKGAKMAAKWFPARGAVRSEPFPLLRVRCPERPGAVKGAPLLGAAKRTLDGEDRSEMIAEEGKAGRNVGERWSAKRVPSPAASNTMIELQAHWTDEDLKRLKLIR